VSTGRGRLTLRASIKVEEQKGARPIIVIDEIPYGIIRKNIVESIANCAKNDLIRDINHKVGNFASELLAEAAKSHWAREGTVARPHSAHRAAAHS